MKKITSNSDLYTEFIKDLYSAEVHEISALHFFEKRATAPDLKDLLHRHTGDTRMHVLRLEDLFDNHKASLIDEHCRTMKSMIDEAKELVNRCVEDEVRDFAIRASVQRIKQCEIMVYRMLVEMAEELQLQDERKILLYNLREDSGFLELLQKLNTPVAG